MNSSSSTRQRCPICRADIAGSPAPPFCSERCRTIDLGNWLGESYRVPIDETPSHEAPASDGDDDDGE